MAELAEFRSEVAAWLAENCPEGARGPGQIPNGSSKITLERDVALWLERMAERGWTAPTWQNEHPIGSGGARRPDFLTVDDVVVTIVGRAGAKAR